MKQRDIRDYDALYSSDADEAELFETKRDAILTEGLGFYRFDSTVDEDIVDADDEGEVADILENGEQSEFFGKKKKKKRKEKRKKRKEKRKKEVRKFLDRQKQNVKDFKKQPLKAIGSGIKEIARSVKQTSLAVPRASVLGLIRLNYRGLATK